MSALDLFCKPLPVSYQGRAPWEELLAPER